MRSLRIITLVVFFTSGWISGLSAQIGTPAFAAHLIRQADYQAMLDLTGFIEPGLSTLQTDSMEFYTGWAHFHLRELTEAVPHFRSVSSGSSFFEQSRLFSSWSNLYLTEVDQARQDLDQIARRSADHPLILFQELALALYERQFETAAEQLSLIRCTQTPYSEQTDQLETIMEYGQGYRQKSRGLAAGLSALMPGAGKIYAGETGAGISSFLILAGLGGVAAENIIKSGPLSWNSLVFSGLFAVFYVGNIYGSMISVQTYRDRFNENYRQSILATVVIPMRDWYR